MRSLLRNISGAAVAVTFLLAGCKVSQGQQKPDFSKVAEEFVYGSLALSPVSATQISVRLSNGIFGGQYHFTDTTNGRGTLTTSTNSFFGSSNSAFYALDPFGDFIVVPQDTTVKDPQLIFVGP